MEGSAPDSALRGAFGSWVVLDHAGVDPGPVNVGLSIYTDGPTTGAADVKVAFDDFHVNSGEIDCS